MQLKQNEIHVWSVNLTITTEQENLKLALLSKDECERAQRFRFAIHRQRYIAARSSLREILGLYANLAPQDIVFGYTENHKPYLAVPNHTHINFNLSHSHNMAVYAFTLNHAVGIDIEKIQDEYNAAVAQRYFSPQEHHDFMQLSEKEKKIGFYRIWARKEAIIKAVGKGVSSGLSTFSVGIHEHAERVQLADETWSLISLSLHPDYQAALASNQIIKTISYWHFFNQKPKLDNVSHL